MVYFVLDGKGVLVGAADDAVEGATRETKSLRLLH